MGFFDKLFGSKEKGSRSNALRRNALNLQLNDIVTYDLEDYIVVGKIVYEASGYEWTAYNLKGDTRSIWLSAEMDDQLELGIYEKVRTKLPENLTESLDYEGKTYYLEERGKARIKAAEGQAGARAGQQIAYWEYESDDEIYLSIEDWGGDLEVSKGYAISEKEIKIIAAS